MGTAGYNMHVAKCKIGRMLEEQASLQAAQRLNEEAAQCAAAERAAVERAEAEAAATELADQVLAHLRVLFLQLR